MRRQNNHASMPQPMVPRGERFRRRCVCACDDPRIAATAQRVTSTAPCLAVPTRPNFAEGGTVAGRQGVGPSFWSRWRIGRNAGVLVRGTEYFVSKEPCRWSSLRPCSLCGGLGIGGHTVDQYCAERTECMSGTIVAAFLRRSCCPCSWKAWRKVCCARCLWEGRRCCEQMQVRGHRGGKGHWF